METVKNQITWSNILARQLYHNAQMSSLRENLLFSVAAHCISGQFSLTELDGNSSSQDFTGPVIKNLPCNAGDVGLISGQGTKIPHAMGQLSPCATSREKPTHPKLRPNTAK